MEAKDIEPGKIYKTVSGYCVIVVTLSQNGKTAFVCTTFDLNDDPHFSSIDVGLIKEEYQPICVQSVTESEGL